MRLQETRSAAAGAPPLLSARLRAETAGQHRAIEANARFARLMATDLGLDEYRGLTVRLYGHHAAAEAALARATPLLPAAIDLPRRLRRTEALSADLAALGVPAPGHPMLPAPRLASAEAAWGLLYVLEGSALGGQLIARHLLLTLGPHTPVAGMVPHGAATGTLWRDFKHLLDEAGAIGGLEQEAVVAAAQTSFATLDAWMA